MQIRTKVVLTGEQPDVDAAIQALYQNDVVSKSWNPNIRGWWKENNDNCLWFASDNEPPLESCEAILEHCKEYQVSVIGMWAAAPPDKSVGYFWVDEDGKLTTAKEDRDSVDTIFITMNLWTEHNVLDDETYDPDELANDDEYEDFDCFRCPHYESCQGNQGNQDNLG